jgi:hypothetical protein
MKKYTDFIVDSFVDYQGIEHHFVIASLSQTLPKTEKELEERCICNELHSKTQPYAW